MWISSEEARSDFILAAAAVFLGVQLVSLVTAVPGYPRSGVGFYVLSLAWMLLLACGAPYALARYRNHVPSAFALAPEDRGGTGPAVAVALPLVVGHVLASVFTGDLGTMLLSLAGQFTVLTPTIGDFRFSLEIAVVMVSVLILAVGSAMTGTFLSVRAHESFRSPDMDLTELLRTFGLGAVGLALVTGMLAAVRDAGSLTQILVRSIVLFAVVLLADQYVPPRVTVPRAAVVGPAVAVVVLWVIAFGGPFGGDLLVGLTAGSAAAAIMVAAATLVHARHGLAAAALLVVSVVYPVGGYPMQPLPLPLLIG